MNHFLLKAILTVLCLSNIVIANCESRSNISTKEQDKSCPLCEMKPAGDSCLPCLEENRIGEPCKCAYNAPANIVIDNGLNIWLSGNFLYWQAKEKGLEVACEYETGYENSYIITKKVDMNFDFHPGFKIGAGYGFNSDDWTLYLEYTRFKSDDTRKKQLSITSGSESFQMFSPWTGQGIESGVLSDIKAKFSLSYNMVDLELGRPFFSGKRLVFKPHYGFRVGWIDQSYNFELHFPYEDKPVVAYLENKQDSNLFGIRVGVNTDWLIRYDFRVLKIFSKVAGSLSYQSYKNSCKQTLPIQVGVTQGQESNCKDDVSMITPNIEFSLGLEYGTYCYNNKVYFSLGAGYDFHYFWNQNLMRSLPGNTFPQAASEGDAGSMMLNGLTITAKVDF